MSNRRVDRRAERRAQAEIRNAATPPERRAHTRRLGCVTGKVRYATDSEARTELVGALVAKNRGKSQRHECRVYACELCGGHHLTSKPLRPATETTR